MRGFQNEKTADQYNNNYRTYYNFARKHQGLNGLTPAQASEIKEPAEWKSLLFKSLSADKRQLLGDSRR